MKRLMLALLCLFPVASAFAGEASSDVVVLFTDSDYRFTVREWKIEHASDGVKKVAIRIAYEIPADLRFIVSVSKQATDVPTEGFVVQELYAKVAGQGETSLVFDDAQPGSVYHFLLWRGVGGRSPSGAICDAAWLDLTPRVHRSFLHKTSGKEK